MLKFEDIQLDFGDLEGYTIRDISTELYREIIFPNAGSSYRIPGPIALVTRDGGTCHRVIDQHGFVHLYRDPSCGEIVVRWKTRHGSPPIKF